MGRLYLGAACVACACVVGCRAPKGILLSLEDISSELQVSRGGSEDHVRMGGLTPTLPGPDAGMPYHIEASGRRRPVTAYGLANEASFVHETRYETTIGFQQLWQIREKLLDLRLKALDAIAGRLKLAGVRRGGNATATATAEAAYDRLKASFNQAHNNAVKSLSYPNVLVFRWTASSQRQARGAFGGLFGASGRRTEDHNGFALVAGLRTARLFVGNDVGAIPHRDHDRSHLRVTTFVMQAQHLVYVSESELGRSFQAKLSATLDQIKDPASGLGESDKIEIEGLIQSVVNASNAGVLTGPVHSVVDPYWANDDADRADGWEEVADVHGDEKKAFARQLLAPAPRAARRFSRGGRPVNTGSYTTFYQIDTDLDTLMELSGG